MTTTRLFVPLLVAMGAISACLPGRDNPSDTSNRPVAVLAIENGPAAGLGCSEADSSLDEEISRGRCVHLSAAGSTDPQGKSDIVEYVFETSTANDPVTGEPSYAVVPPSLSAISSSAAKLVLAPSVLRGFSPNVTIRVRVTVTDETGGTSSDDGETFKLINNEPVALQPGNRYVPAFGALWKRTNGKVGGPLNVRLDGVAIDDEDDPLRFCWRERGKVANWMQNTPCTAAALAEPTVCTTTEEYVLDVVSEGGDPEQAKVIEYDLRVCDGNEWSRPVSASIVYETTPAWAIEQDYTRAVIYDATQRTEEIPYPVVGLPGFLVNSDDQIRAFFGFDDPAINGKQQNLLRMQYVSDSASSPASTLALDPDVAIRKVIPAPAAGMLWVVAAISSNGLGVYGVYGTGAGATFDGPWMPSTPIAAGGEDGIYAAVDSDTGDLWFSANFQQSVWGLSGDSGTVQEIDRIDLAEQIPGEARMVTGVGLRDHLDEQQTDAPHEVWIGHANHVLVPASGDPSGLLIRQPNGSIDTEWFNPLEWVDDVPSSAGATLEFGFGPLFASPVSFYMHYFGEGVGYYALDPATSNTILISFAATPLVGFASAVHPASGHAVIVSEGNQTLLRATPGGTAATLETSERVSDVHRILRGMRLLTYLPAGDGTNARVLLGQGTGVEGLMQRFSIPPAFDRVSQGVDYASGDLWVPSVIPTGAARFYADGRLADFIHSADDGTVTGTPLGAAMHVSTDPADGAVWLVTVRDTSGNANVVWRVDPLGARPGPGIVASGGVTGLELESATDTVLAVGAQPAVETTSSALVMLVRSDNGDDTYDYTLRRLLPDGSYFPVSPVFLTTGDAAPQPVFMSRDIVTPGVCVASRHPSANQVIIRRYGPTLGSYSETLVPTGSSAPRVLALSAYDGDCWTAFRAGSAILFGIARPGVAFSSIPALVSSEPASIVPLMTADSIRPVDKHQALVSFPEESLIRRYLLRTTSGGVVLVEEDEKIRTDGEVKLLTP